MEVQLFQRLTVKDTGEVGALANGECWALSWWREEGGWADAGSRQEQLGLLWGMGLHSSTC